MNRRYGRPPISGQLYVPRPGVYAILPVGDGLLVTHQTTPKPELQLPGGGVDPGEQPLRALYREVLEETGWQIARPVRLGQFKRFTYMPEYSIWAEKLCTVYLANPTRKLCDPLEPGHSAEVISVAEALASLGNAGDRAFVKSWFNRSWRL
ncbi:NUDIX domain-containing protein [Primorskyibacter sp. S187A]|uniref:NUDIX domain-containing protein n=1 Tax=Primorskyibacter sp. S187A TaxID=3415130 RepID=UPI003C797764